MPVDDIAALIRDKVAIFTSEELDISVCLKIEPTWEAMMEALASEFGWKADAIDLSIARPGSTPVFLRQKSWPACLLLDSLNIFTPPHRDISVTAKVKEQRNSRRGCQEVSENIVDAAAARRLERKLVGLLQNPSRQVGFLKHLLLKGPDSVQVQERLIRRPCRHYDVKYRDLSHYCRRDKYFVKTLTGKTIRIKACVNSPAGIVKHLIQQHEGIPPDQQRLIFAGSQLRDEDLLGHYGLTENAMMHLVLRLAGGKPVIYLMPPEKTHVEVKLCLHPEWSFSAVYPIVPVLKEQTNTAGSTHDDFWESVEWNVDASPDGTLLIPDQDLEASYLFWEALTNEPKRSLPWNLGEDSFSPARPCIDECHPNAVIVPISLIGTYLDKSLKALGLHTEARTSFITYWLPDLLKHEHIALRFVPQNAYSASAPLRITPQPDVITRVFMLFRGVEPDQLDRWQAAAMRAEKDVSFWLEVVEVDMDKHDDPDLFRVLEWGGMEVM